MNFEGAKDAKMKQAMVFESPCGCSYNRGEGASLEYRLIRKACSCSLINKCSPGQLFSPVSEKRDGASWMTNPNCKFARRNSK